MRFHLVGLRPGRVFTFPGAAGSDYFQTDLIAAPTNVWRSICELFWWIDSVLHQCRETSQVRCLSHTDRTIWNTCSPFTTCVKPPRWLLSTASTNFVTVTNEPFLSHTRLFSLAGECAPLKRFCTISSRRKPTVQTASSCSLCASLRNLSLYLLTYFPVSRFLKWHWRASYLILSSSAFTPSTSLPPTPLWRLSSVSSLPLLAFSKTIQVTLRNCQLLLPASVILFIFPGFPPWVSLMVFIELWDATRWSRGNHIMLKVSLVCLRRRTQASAEYVSVKKRSSFESVFSLCLQPISNADFIVPVEIDGTVHQVLWSTRTGRERHRVSDVIFGGFP